MNRMSIQDAQTVLQSSSSTVDSLNQAAAAALMRVGRSGQEAWIDAVNDKPSGDQNLSRAYNLVQREGVTQEDGTLVYKNAALTIKSDGYGIAVARNLDNRVILEGDGISGVASINNLERRDVAAINQASDASHAAGGRESLPRLRSLAQEFGRQSQDQSTMTFQTSDYRIVTDGDNVELYRTGQDTPILSGSANAGVVTENKLNGIDRQVLADVPNEEQIGEMRQGIAQQTGQTPQAAAPPPSLAPEQSQANQPAGAPPSATPITPAQSNESGPSSSGSSAVEADDDLEL